MKRRWLIPMSFVLALTMVLSACSSDDTADTTTTAAPADTTVPDDVTTTTAAPVDTTVPNTDPIKIGMLTSLTATFAPWGVSVRDGMKLAADEINAAGGVNGRMIELIERDTQSNPEEGVSGFERMIEDGVVAAGGVISSDVALSTARVAEELQVPLFLVKAGTDAVLTQDSRYTFRTCLVAAPMVTEPLAQWVQAEGITKVGAIVADYAWGQAIKSGLENSFADIPGVELLIEVAPVPEQDFSSYLRKLQDFGAEVLVATGHPPGGVSIVKQSADFGMDIPVTGSWNPIALIVNAVGDQAIDRYADFACVDYDSPEYQDLARRYLAMSDNSFMEDDAVAGFGIVHAVAEAVGAVGDDPAAVAQYLHDNSFDIPGYSFPLSWTAWGEIAAAQPTFTVMREMTPPEGVNPGANWYPELLIKSEPLEPYVP
ncbi:MAG: ABC transporter substrate-binding protein [Acidimicrobiia bacterium]|nr:ABC transporter substrate-binding protein [Acidimicrobiia bacterium]